MDARDIGPKRMRRREGALDGRGSRRVSFGSGEERREGGQETLGQVVHKRAVAEACKEDELLRGQGQRKETRGN